MNMCFVQENLSPWNVIRYYNETATETSYTIGILGIIFGRDIERFAHFSVPNLIEIGSMGEKSQSKKHFSVQEPPWCSGKTTCLVNQGWQV